MTDIGPTLASPAQVGRPDLPGLAGPTWQTRAAQLADELRDAGDLRSPEWYAAVSAVPRHLLVPLAYMQDDTGAWQEIDTATADGLDLVYSTNTLVTALEQRDGTSVSVSSSTKPDLVVRMLEYLNVAEGHRVLEIGTGTGYNAGLLTHRLGDELVTSVDIDPVLVDRARERLAAAGLRPHLAAVDGADGLPGRSPYDRIVATCSVPRIPWSWAEQLAPGGLVLADIKRGVGAGNLALLARDPDQPDRLDGRFTPRWAAFMAMRHAVGASTAGSEGAPGASRQPLAPRSAATTRTTIAPPMPWQQSRVAWLLASFALPQPVGCGARLDPRTRQPVASRLTAADGSWAEVELSANDDGRHDLTEAGPTPLWSAVENAHRQWQDLGEPDWPSVRITVTPSEQWVWCGSADNGARWTIPT